jgi:hypothetical protein
LVLNKVTTIINLTYNVSCLENIIPWMVNEVKNFAATSGDTLIEYVK